MIISARVSGKMHDQSGPKNTNTGILMVLLTRKCQFNCTYCNMERIKSDISEKNLRKAINLLFTSNQNELELHFFGGEPLLRYDLIKKGVLYAERLAKKTDKKINFIITTNALLLDEKKISFLSNHNTTLMFSIDGKKSSFDKNRKQSAKNMGSFDKIIRNIRKTKSSGCKYFVNMLVSPNTVDRMFDNFRYLVGVGINNIKISYELGTHWDQKNKQKFMAGLEEALSFTKPLKNVELLNLKVDEPVFASPVLVVDIDGQLFRGCSIVLENILPNLQKNLYIGNISEIKQIKQLEYTLNEQISQIKNSKDIPKSEMNIIENNLNFGEKIGKKIVDFKETSRLKERVTELERTNPTQKSIMVMLTKTCQLRCNYCEVKLGKEYLPKKTLFKIIDLLSKSKGEQIRFFGGEPLLRFDLIKDAINYAEKKKYDTRFSITTNGIVLSKDKIDFLKNHNTHVMFSIDGSEDTHKVHRISKNGSTLHTKILNNLKGLIVSGIPYFVNIVVTPKTSSMVEENVKFLAGLGVKDIQICYESAIIWKKDEISTIKKFMERARQFAKSLKINILNFSNLCEPVILSQEIIADVDGKLYYDAAIFLEKTFPELRKAYFIDNIDGVTNLSKIQKSKPELFDIFIKSLAGNHKKQEIFINNVQMGLELASIVDSKFGLMSRNNENLLLKEFISGSLDFQEEFKKKHALDIDSYVLYVGSGCDNDCIICRNKEEKEERIIDIKKKIEQNRKFRLRKIALVGNDPLTHTRILDIIRLCKENNFKEIEIMTSGNWLGDKNLINSLSDLGVKITFSLPLMGPNAEVHDGITQNKGSFSNIMRGIRNIIHSPNLDVYIHTNLINQNIDFMNELEDLVKNKLKLPFVILPIRPKDSNIPYKKLMPPYTEMAEKLNVSSLMGFPLCVTNKMQKSRILTEDNISDSMKVYFLDQKFVKLKCCKDCSYRKKCSGTFKQYVKNYGVRELKPIKNKLLVADNLISNKIKEFYVMLSLNCSLKCKVCPYWGVKGACYNKSFNKKYCKNTLLELHIRKLLNGLKKLEVDEITFSGGEPLECSKWHKFSKILKKLNTRMSITTNGTLLLENLDEIYKYFDQINISLEGSPAEIFSNVRVGKKENLDKIIFALKKITEHKKKYGSPNLKLLYVISDLSYKHIRTLLDYLKKEKIEVDEFYFQYQMFLDRETIEKHSTIFKQEFNVNSNLIRGFEYKPKKMDFNLLKKQIEYAKRNCSKISLSPELNNGEVANYFGEGKVPEKYTNCCKAPWNQLSLLPNGDLWVCHDYSIGNIKKNSLENLWNGKKIMNLRKRVLEKGTFPGCKGCFYLYAD